MKYIPLLGLLFGIANPSYAELMILEYDCSSSPPGMPATVLDFGDVELPIEGQTVDTSRICLTIINTGEGKVSNIIPTISGKSSEFQIDNGCFNYVLEKNTPENMQHCFIDITFSPVAHYGKRNRKFTVDALETLSGLANEISVTLPAVGTSFNLNKP